MDPLYIEETDDWLASPTPLETCRQQLRLYENEFDELNRQLREERERIFKLVEMHSEAVQQRDWYMATLREKAAEIANLRREISSLRPPFSTARPSRHILKEDVPAQLERLLCLRCPCWRLNAGGVVMRGAAGGVRHLAVDHLVCGNPALRQLAERDLLHADQELIVRVGLVPAAELVRLLADASVALAPPRIGLSIKNTVADRPGHGDLTGRALAAPPGPRPCRW